MAIPSYTTDLATINLCTGTWVELTGAASGSAPTENDTDNFIAGIDSTTEAVRNAGLSSMASPNANITVTSGGAVFMWLYFAAMPVVDLLSNGGYRVAIGQDASNYNMWNVYGGDTKPYGGWISIAVDPTATISSSQGTPTAVTATFGSVVNLTSGISKGNAFANDYQRHGRSLIVEAGSLGDGYATFNGAALVNDAVTARWGLFAKVDGGYSQKGLFQMGSSGTAVDFLDADVNITIEDVVHATTSFNEFEVLNSGSVISWTGIQISSLGTNARGNFTVTDNATINKTGCTFNDMGTFIYQSNSTIETSTYRRCGLITQGGGTFTSDVFDKASGTVALSVDDISLVTKNTFNSDGSNHAVDLGNFAADETITWDNTLSGYASSDGSTGNEAIIVDVDSGIILTISVSSTGTRPYINNTGLGTVIVVTEQITIKVTVYDDSTGLPLEFARVQLNKDSDQSQILSAETDVNGIVSTTLSYTADIPVHGWARQWDLSGDDFTPKNIGGTIDASGLTINVRLSPI